MPKPARLLRPPRPLPPSAWIRTSHPAAKRTAPLRQRRPRQARPKQRLMSTRHTRSMSPLAPSSETPPPPRTAPRPSTDRRNAPTPRRLPHRRAAPRPCRGIGRLERSRSPATRCHGGAGVDCNVRGPRHDEGERRSRPSTVNHRRAACIGHRRYRPAAVDRTFDACRRLERARAAAPCRARRRHAGIAACRRGSRRGRADERERRATSGARERERRGRPRRRESGGRRRLARDDAGVARGRQARRSRPERRRGNPIAPLPDASAITAHEDAPTSAAPDAATPVIAAMDSAMPNAVAPASAIASNAGMSPASASAAAPRMASAPASAAVPDAHPPLPAQRPPCRASLRSVWPRPASS